MPFNANPYLSVSRSVRGFLLWYVAVSYSVNIHKSSRKHHQSMQDPPHLCQAMIHTAHSSPKLLSGNSCELYTYLALECHKPKSSGDLSMFTTLYLLQDERAKIIFSLKQMGTQNACKTQRGRIIIKCYRYITQSDTFPFVILLNINIKIKNSKLPSGCRKNLGLQ